MKWKIIIVADIILIAVLVYAFFIYEAPPLIKPEFSNGSATIEYPPEYNYKQTINDCGPFNTAAVVRSLTGEDVDSATFAEEIEWRLPNKYTLPWGLEKQLKDHGIEIETPNLNPVEDDRKILYLQQILDAQKPIIILGKQNGFQHYITLFGYEGDNFHVYNPLYDDDKNRESPGNRDMSSEELLEFWKGGGMYGFYNWYAIVNS